MYKVVLHLTFINTVYLYDDKMIITFNYKDDSKVVTLNDVKKSDMRFPVIRSAPKKNLTMHWKRRSHLSFQILIAMKSILRKK